MESVGSDIYCVVFHQLPCCLSLTGAVHQTRRSPAVNTKSLEPAPSEGRDCQWTLVFWALVLMQLGDVILVQVLMMAASAPSRVSWLTCIRLPRDLLSVGVGFQEQAVPELQASKRQVVTPFPFASWGCVSFSSSPSHSEMGIFDFS